MRVDSVPLTVIIIFLTQSHQCSHDHPTTFCSHHRPFCVLRCALQHIFRDAKYQLKNAQKLLAISDLVPWLFRKEPGNEIELSPANYKFQRKMDALFLQERLYFFKTVQTRAQQQSKTYFAFFVWYTKRTHPNPTNQRT